MLAMSRCLSFVALLLLAAVAGARAKMSADHCVHAIDHVKKLPDAELISGTTIVDLEGGLPLAITEELTTPGMMLLFDQSGQLMVADEVTDQQMFRTYTYAEERGE